MRYVASRLVGFRIGKMCFSGIVSLRLVLFCEWPNYES